MKYRFKILIIIEFFLVPLGAAHSMEMRRTQYLMGSLCEIQTFGDDPTKINQAISSAFEEIARLESILTTWRDSEVLRLNQEGTPVAKAASRDLVKILSLSQQYASLTHGAFDVTVGPLIKIWDLQGKGRIPADREINRTLTLVGWRHLTLNEASSTIRFHLKGMALDFGAIGKGYALDRAAEVLKKAGIRSALLNFSGQILVFGPERSQKGWPIEISHPADPARKAGALHLSNASVSTSSQWERSKTVAPLRRASEDARPAGGGSPAAGRRVGHIMDPRSGRPAPFQGSVTVIAPTGAAADALSTALAVLGPEEGISFMERQTHMAAVFLIQSPDKKWMFKASSKMPKIKETL